MPLKNFQNKKIVALIPLRGGSKSIPGKNIRPIAGKVLAAWVLQAAAKSECFDKICVSTDSREIADTVSSLALNIEIIDRPPELATDFASTDEVMMHFSTQIPFDVLVTIQATSPLLSPLHLREGLVKFFNGRYDSLLSAVPFNRFLWNIEGEPLNYDPSKRPRRQEIKPVYMENGAFYITLREALLSTRCRISGKTGIYEMPVESGYELDEPSDWPVVEALLREDS